MHWSWRAASLLFLTSPALAWAPDGVPTEPEPEPEPEPGTTSSEVDGGSEVSGGETLPVTPAEVPSSGPAWVVGLHVGPAFALSPLNTAFQPRLEFAVELPFAGRRLRPFLTAAWSKPVAEGSAEDDRLPSGSSDYRLDQTLLTLGLGAWVALLPPERRVVPEVGVGPEVFLLRSRVTGSSDGAAFPESREQYTRVGALVAAGARFGLGPGELAAHLSWHGAKLDGLVTGDSNAMQVGASVGYRLVF